MRTYKLASNCVTSRHGRPRILLFHKGGLIRDKSPTRAGSLRRAVSKWVILGTENSRKSGGGASRDLFHTARAISYQRRSDIRFVPIFPNACLLAHDTLTILATSRQKLVGRAQKACADVLDFGEPPMQPCLGSITRSILRHS